MTVRYTSVVICEGCGYALDIRTAAPGALAGWRKLMGKTTTPGRHGERPIESPADLGDICPSCCDRPASAGP